MKSAKNKIIKFFEWLQNNNGILEIDTKLKSSEYRNIKRPIIYQYINNKRIVLSNKQLKDYVKEKNKNTCYINDPQNCRYFIDKNNNKYIEIHHVIPISLQEKYNINLDIEQNMVPICVFHHKMIHNACNNEFMQIIKYVWEKKKNDLLQIDKNITFEKLVALY